MLVVMDYSAASSFQLEIIATVQIPMTARSHLVWITGSVATALMKNMCPVHAKLDNRVHCAEPPMTRIEECQSGKIDAFCDVTSDGLIAKRLDHAKSAVGVNAKMGNRVHNATKSRTVFPSLD